MSRDFITYKRIRKNKDGNDVVSLSDKFLSDFSKVSILGKGIISNEEECRPDKLSYKWYSNSKYDWVIMKFNGISNPYSLKEGVEYLVPVIEEFMKLAGNKSTQDKPKGNSDDQKALNSKRFFIDSNKVEYNNRKKPTDKIIPSTGVSIINGQLVFSDNDSYQTGSGNVTLEEVDDLIEDITLPEICPENCDNTNPEICALCKCKPKASDVLIYKMLNKVENNNQKKPTDKIIPSTGVSSINGQLVFSDNDSYQPGTGNVTLEEVDDLITDDKASDVLKNKKLNKK